MGTADSLLLLLLLVGVVVLVEASLSVSELDSVAAEEELQELSETTDPHGGVGGRVRVGGGEASSDRGFSASLSHGEGGASPKSCSSGTSHSDTPSGRTGSKTQDMVELINGRGWGEEENNKGCTRKN